MDTTVELAVRTPMAHTIAFVVFLRLHFTLRRSQIRPSPPPQRCYSQLRGQEDLGPHKENVTARAIFFGPLPSSGIPNDQDHTSMISLAGSSHQLVRKRKRKRLFHVVLDVNASKLDSQSIVVSLHTVCKRGETRIYLPLFCSGFSFLHR